MTGIGTHHGIITHYDILKGFGFVRGNAPEDLFFHRSELRIPGNVHRRNIALGSTVTFEVGEFRGRACAVNVTPIESEGDTASDKQ